MSKNISTALTEVQSWIDIPGVEGIGQGVLNNKACIIVFSSVDPSELKGKIPLTYAGYPVKIEFSGHLEIQ
jgi:hypothetical protein